MPTPKNSNAVYRPDLGLYVMERATEQDTFVAERIFPTMPVDEAAGVFPVIPMEALFSAPDDERRPRGAYQRDDWSYEEGRYATSERGREEVIDDAERARLDRRAPGLADYMAAKRCIDKIKRRREKRVADKIFNASNFTAHDVSNEWDDAANATPIDDVGSALVAFRAQCGMLPDVLLMNWRVFRNVRKCTQIQNRLQYTFPGLDRSRITAEQLAAILDVREVLVTDAQVNTANKGLDASLSEIWSGEYAALLKLCTPGDYTTPGVGHTFLFTPDSPDMLTTETYREEQVRGDVLRVRYDADENFLKSYDDDGNVVSNIAAACVYLLGNITT